MEAEHREKAKLRTALRGFCDPETARAVTDAADLPTTADDIKKAVWVKSVCAELEKRFAPETIREIRRLCHCDEEGQMAKMKSWLKGLFRESSGLEEFVDRVNAAGAGWYLRDGEIYTKFLGCECHMLGAVDRLDSKTWCQCTVGYTEELFTHVFDCPVEGELLQTIKMGHEFCVVKIRRLDR